MVFSLGRDERTTPARGSSAMTRISELPVDRWDPQLRQMLEGSGIVKGTVQYRGNSVMAHAPHMATASTAFMRAAMGGRTLSPRLVELVRLRLAFHNQCRSCMAMRFQSAVTDGVTEDLVCSLEKPAEAKDLNTREKYALEFADIFATNHFAINDDTFSKLREQFTESEIVELGMFVAYFTGMGRFLACLDLVEDLPKNFQDKSHKAAPWDSGGQVITINDGQRTESPHA
jgi:AhpD family alkylhydroperoxidase